MAKTTIDGHTANAITLQNAARSPAILPASPHHDRLSPTQQKGLMTSGVHVWFPEYFETSGEKRRFSRRNKSALAIVLNHHVVLDNISRDE